MKKRTFLFAGLCTLITCFSACTSEQLISTQPASEVQVLARDGVGEVITKDEDFEGVFLQALEVVDYGGYVIATPADGGCTIQIVKELPADFDPVSKQRVCCGDGLSFARCAQGYMNAGKIVTAGKCSAFNDDCGKYCAYTD